MKTRNTKLKVLAVCLFVAITASIAPAGTALKTSEPKAGCQSIFAVEEYVLTTDGCTSPIGFCAAGTFRGNHGFRGTAQYSAVSFDPIPSDSLGRLVAPGRLTYTTDEGSISVDDVSIFDVARGTFTGVSRIVSGTGRYAGASGDIFTAGHVLPDGSFTDELSGEVCLPQ